MIQFQRLFALAAILLATPDCVCLAQYTGFTVDSIHWIDFEEHNIEELHVSEQTTHIDQNRVFAVTAGGELKRLGLNPDDLEIEIEDLAILPDLAIHSILETNTFACVLGFDDSENGFVNFIQTDGSIWQAEVEIAQSTLIEGGFFLSGSTVTLFTSITADSDSISLRKWSIIPNTPPSFEDVMLPQPCEDVDLAVLKGVQGSNYLLQVGCGIVEILDMETSNSVYSYSGSWGELVDVSMKFVDQDQDNLREQYFLCKRNYSEDTWLFKFEPSFSNGITPASVEVSYNHQWQNHNTPSLDPLISFSNEAGHVLHGLVHAQDSSFRVLSEYNLRYGIPLGHDPGESIISTSLPGYNEPQFLIFAGSERVGIARTNSTRVVDEFFVQTENNWGGIGNEDHFHAQGGPVDLVCVNQSLFKSSNSTDSVQLELIHQFSWWTGGELSEPLIHFNPTSSEFRLLGRNNLHYVLDSLGNFIDTLGYESPSFQVLYDIDDLDGDGDGDVWFYRDGFIRMLKNISGNFGDEIPLFALEQSNWNTQASDLDGNGLIDFVWFLEDSLHIATNAGDFNFSFTSIPLESGSLVPTYVDAVHGSYILIERDAHIVQYKLQGSELVEVASFPVWSLSDYAAWKSYSRLSDDGELELVLGNLDSHRAYFNSDYYEPFHSYA